MKANIQQIIEQIEHFFKLEDYESICEILSDELLVQHNNAILYSSRARAHLRLNKADLSLLYVERSINIDPSLAINYITRGNAYLVKEEYDNAIADFTDAIRLKPDNSGAYYNRGYTCFLKKDFNKAISDFTDAIRLNPKSAGSYYNRGNSWYNKAEYDKAIADFTDAILLNPKFAGSYYSRALSWERKQEYDKAIADFTNAIRLDPNYAGSFHNRGNAWAGKQEYDKAIADFTDAIRLDPSYAGGYYNRGNAWLGKNEYDNAITDYNEAIRLDPNYSLAYNNRALSWEKKQEYDKAIADFTDAIRSDPNLVIAYNNRGSTWSTIEKHKKAIADFTNAIRLDPNFAIAYYNRADDWNKTKQYNKAIKDYEHYIKIIDDPNEYYTQISLEQIEEIKDKIENAWYDELNNVVNNVKQLLLFENPHLTHYTSLTGAQAMILGNSLFRLSEGSFLNDTSEGRELFNYLSISSTKRTDDETMSKVFIEKPFIGSFVADNKHNDLTLWRMYGKEAQAEAKGCALTINKASFVDDLKKKLSPPDFKTGIQSQSNEQFTFYNVAYLSKDKFIISEKSEEIVVKFNNLMSDLKVRIKNITEQQEGIAIKLLNDIAYLFKSSEYQYENEVRLVVRGTGFKKKLEYEKNLPKVYIEMVDIVPSLNKITLGPKVERAEEWAAVFSYHIKQQLKDMDNNVDIIISHLPFK